MELYSLQHTAIILNATVLCEVSQLVNMFYESCSLSAVFFLLILYKRLPASFSSKV